MTPVTESVRLEATQVPEASEVLGRAFQDDPGFTWLLPDESKRSRDLPWFMGVYARYCHRYGEIHTTLDQVNGVAVWVPPGKFPVSTIGLMLGGMIFAPFKLGPAAFGRFIGATNYMENLHERDAPLRHWYLAALGVDPSRQGHGVGGKLIEPVLARADAEGLPCYLESANPRNLGFYGRHGFEVVTEGHLPSGGPPLWTMKREPVR